MGSDDKDNNSDSHNTVLYIQMGACVLLIASRYALHLLGEHQAMADVIVGGGILAKDIYANFLYKAEESDKKAGDAFTKKYKEDVFKKVMSSKVNKDSDISQPKSETTLDDAYLNSQIEGNTDDDKAARELLKTLIENYREINKVTNEKKEEIEKAGKELTKAQVKVVAPVEIKGEMSVQDLLNKERENINKAKTSGSKLADLSAKVLNDHITKKSNQGRSAQAFRSEWQDIVAMLLNVAVLGSGALDLAKVKPFHQSGKGRSRSRRQRGGKKRSRSKSKRSRSKSRRRRRSKKH